jgi:micrococcal nuclease
VISLVKAVVGLVAVAGVTTGVVVATTAGQKTEQIVVTGHVDGDTFDVSADGQQTRIRLLNIDTPETKDPNQPVQCLGPEASAFLAGLLPIGTPVRLEYDAKKEDQYGRILAAAFLSDGRMVNAEIAREGLAAVVSFDGNDKFRPPIEQAWQEAASARRGLHAEAASCTYPAQVKTVADTVAAAPTSANQSDDAAPAALYTAANQTGLARSAALTLLNKLTTSTEPAWVALTPDHRTTLTDRVRTAETLANQEETALRRAGDAAAAREADERARAEAEALRAEAAQAEADRRAQSEAARRAQTDTSTTSSSAGSSGSSSTSSGGLGTRPRTGNTGHPCLPGERDGDNDGYCGEG